jgi:hypothetical protein
MVPQVYSLIIEIEVVVLLVAGCINKRVVSEVLSIIHTQNMGIDRWSDVKELKTRREPNESIISNSNTVCALPCAQRR